MAFQIDKTKFSSATGFGMVELLIVITLVGTLSTIALINTTKSNKSVNVASSMRALSAYLEKVRTDSVRRHGAATISLDSTSSYTISIDADGDGTATTAKSCCLQERASAIACRPRSPTSLLLISQ